MTLSASCQVTFATGKFDSFPNMSVFPPQNHMHLQGHTFPIHFLLPGAYTKLQVSDPTFSSGSLARFPVYSSYPRLHRGSRPRSHGVAHNTAKYRLARAPPLRGVPGANEEHHLRATPNRGVARCSDGIGARQQGAEAAVGSVRAEQQVFQYQGLECELCKRVHHVLGYWEGGS